MDDNFAVPSYTPTPIRLLDESKQRRSELVYNPTPIDELNLYAPKNFAAAYAPVPSTLFTPEAPTYSPVVPSATSECASSKPLGYSPSKFASKRARCDSQCSSSLQPETIKEPDPEENLAEVDEKRRKILALYCDLYDKPEKPTPSPSSQTPLPPSGLPSASSVKLSSKPANTLPQTWPKQPLRPSNKIPMSIRKRYLDQFVEACIKICPVMPEAYDMALQEEQTCHDKAINRHAYLHSVLNCLTMFKSRPVYVDKPLLLPVQSDATPVPIQKHDSLKEGPAELVKGVAFYRGLRPFLLTESDLICFNFPRSDTSKGAPRGRAIINVPSEKENAVNLYKVGKRLCCRCSKIYEVDKFGFAITEAKCVYHWGKVVRQRMPDLSFGLRYSCCQAESGDEGCQIAPAGHVTDANKWCDLDGFLATLPPALDNSTDGSRVNVYSLDCEMVYTAGGYELGRVTVVDANLNVVLDKVVRPLNPIIDANTRFSGLSVEQLKASEYQITDVQMEILQLWDEDTILIGHSLENDLTALKFIHNKVVDTSVVFPHPRGLPYRRALRTLAQEYLMQIIQNDDSGHDSKEDALACMRLMQMKVKGSMQRRMPRSS